jgi:hypothetical protein
MRRGTCVAVGRLRQATRGLVGVPLVQLGVRAIPFGIAAVALGFVLKSPGTQAGPADAGLRGAGISVFGTIHPDIFRLPAPIGSGPLADPLRVASLATPVASDAAANRQDMLTDAPTSALRNAAIDRCFGAIDDHPASFEQRFASVDDCPTSFDESFESAMRQRASGQRSPTEPDVQTAAGALESPADAAPIAIALNTAASPEQAPKDDDSRTAIYDITARAVYLPSGRRLEAHSGIGGLMDNPHHVRVRMRGATPPNVYKLSLRGALFHGVRALRLTPIDDSKMYGRDGMLAHSYMLGAKGQSHGCVVFSNYPEFLNAFIKGEVTRLAVVERLESPPGPQQFAAGRLPDAVRDLLKGSDRGRQIAAAAGDH